MLKKKLVRATDVANLILNIQDRIALRNGHKPDLTLQKLMYMVYISQGMTFVKNGEKLFEDECLAVNDNIIIPSLIEDFGSDLDKQMTARDLASKNLGGYISLSEQEAIIQVAKKYDMISVREMRDEIINSEPYLKASITEDHVIKRSYIRDYFWKLYPGENEGKTLQIIDGEMYFG